MEDLIPLFEPTQDGDGVLHRRLIYHNRLESSFQCRVFFNIFPVFIQGRGPNTMKLSSCQHWFEHISRIHRALRFSGTHDGMQLIDEKDHLSITVFHFFQNGFQTLLKLAPVLRPGNERSHVQSEQSFIL